jgi:competence protein ComEA
VPQLSRSEIAMYAACAVLIAVLGWRSIGRGGSPAAAHAQPSRTPAVSVSAGPSRSAIVHVVGAVRRPGVYRLSVGQRVQDAIRRAGGARPAADLQAINLAAKLADAQQVVVPKRVSTGSAASGGVGVAASGGETSGALTPAASAPVSLNTANAEQLDTLDGVGPATAEKILQFRTEHGGFTSVDDLAQIPGIGPKRLESLRSQVQL